MLILQLLINGVAAGLVYGLVALSFAIIYCATKHFHIAHAATFAIAPYLAAVLYRTLHLPIAFAIAVGVAVAVIFGLAIVRLLYIPLTARGAGPFTIFLTSLGILFMVDNLFTLWLGTSVIQLSVPQLNLPILTPAGAVTILQLFLVGGGILALLLLSWFLHRTRAGVTLRAMNTNPGLLRIIGYSTGTTQLVVYALGSLLVALVGIYVGIAVGVKSGIGEFYFIIAFVCVILSGGANLYGSLAIGIILGVLENILQLWIPSTWTSAFILTAFLIALTLSPNGVFMFFRRTAVTAKR